MPCGLRGVGKGVLLDRIRQTAERDGVQTLRMEASENRSLPSLLVPRLRSTLLRLGRHEAAKNGVRRALRGLTGFAKSLKVRFDGVELSFDFGSERGLADSGDLESDLPELL